MTETYAAQAPSAVRGAPVSQMADGALSYTPDEAGNVVPEFSMAGYRNGGVALPVAPVLERLAPVADSADESVRIQAALNRVANAPADPATGVRGAVLLTRGSYRCGETITIPAGVTLRGEGAHATGTVLIATMLPEKGAEAKSTLLQLTSKGSLPIVGPAHAVLDESVPIGAKHLSVKNAGAFEVGDEIIIVRAPSEAWIHDLQMDRIKLSAGGKQWAPEIFVVRWQSRVDAIAGDRLTLDSPVLCALERRYGGAKVYACGPDTRGRAAAVENIRLESVYEKGHETEDECHAWNAISIGYVVDSWVRDVTALHFAYACINIGRTAARITVQDCAMIDPVSLLTGGRRYSFVGGGQYCLFQRCYTRNGRHDFVTGAQNVGPTVFLDCLSEEAHSDIGPHHRWSCGQLYDNVKGGAIHVQDRGGAGTGHGWAGNAQVLWNCEARRLICQKPWPASAQNWAIGCSGEDGKPLQSSRLPGLWFSRDTPVSPRSLYLAQLRARITASRGDGDVSIRSVTTPEQAQGTVWAHLRERYQDEPSYAK